MKTVWKYEIPIDNYFVLILPKGTKPLSVQTQRGVLCLWCLVDLSSLESEERIFRLAGTGHPINDENIAYVGTFQAEDGYFIGHLFEVINGDTK
jgi:hypothetical protein